MKRYIIKIYTGWSVYDPMIKEIVLPFESEDAAKKYAEEVISGTNYGFSTNLVWPD